MEVPWFKNHRPSLAVEPQLATPAWQTRFWVLDVDNSVKNFDAAIRTITLEMDTLKTIRINSPFMREYQSMLFCLGPQPAFMYWTKLGQLISIIDTEHRFRILLVKIYIIWKAMPSISWIFFKGYIFSFRSIGL